MGVLCCVVHLSRFLVGLVGVYDRTDSGRGPDGGVACGVRECRAAAAVEGGCVAMLAWVLAVGRLCLCGIGLCVQ